MIMIKKLKLMMFSKEVVCKIDKIVLFDRRLSANAQ